jgi:hypothetical protein
VIGVVLAVVGVVLGTDKSRALPVRHTTPGGLRRWSATSTAAVIRLAISNSCEIRTANAVRLDDVAGDHAVLRAIAPRRHRDQLARAPRSASA